MGISIGFEASLERRLFVQPNLKWKLSHVAILANRRVSDSRYVPFDGLIGQLEGEVRK